MKLPTMDQTELRQYNCEPKTKKKVKTRLNSRLTPRILTGEEREWKVGFDPLQEIAHPKGVKERKDGY